MHKDEVVVQDEATQKECSDIDDEGDENPCDPVILIGLESLIELEGITCE